MLKKFILLLLINACVTPVYAGFIKDFLYTPDQQAMQLLKKGRPLEAARVFDNNQWRASSLYRGGQYQKSLDFFAEDKSSDGYYNQGNCLAKLGQYQQAIDKYNTALEKNPDNKDARFNKDILQKLLKKQNQNKKNNASQNQSNQQKKQDSKNKQSKNKPESQRKKNKQPEQSKQNKKNEQKNKSAQKKSNAAKKESMANNKKKQAQREQRQSDQQWLNRVPDNPAGLLQRKFLRDYYRQRQEQAS